MGTIPDYPRGLTFEEVWAALMENRKQQEKTEKEIKRVSKIVGKLGNSIGELVEILIAAKLWEKFSAYPYNFKRAYRRVQVFDDNTHRQLTDIDIMLSDTEWIMAVEVKRDVNKRDVEDHIIRMDKIRRNPPAETRGKKLLGAMAGGLIAPEACDLAYQSGFFVLELQGESVGLVPPPEGFLPKIWS